MAEGWIKIYRSIQDHYLWQDKPYSQGQAWIDLLLLAERETKTKPYRSGSKIYEKGKVYKSVLELSDRWGWSRSRTVRFLKKLESDTTIRTTSDTTNGTTITIANYSVYQDRRTTNRTANRTAPNPPKKADNEQYNEPDSKPDNAETAQNHCAATILEVAHGASGQRTGQRSEQKTDILKEYKEDKKEKEINKEKEIGGCAPDGRPAKGTPEYERWRNQ